MRAHGKDAEDANQDATEVRDGWARRAGDPSSLAAPDPREHLRLFDAAAQRPNLSSEQTAAVNRARAEITECAERTAKELQSLEGVALTDEECAILRPAHQRKTHLPSPQRPYGHLAVRTRLGGLSVTPLWVAQDDRCVVLSTVENRIKTRASALDPLVAMSVPAGIGSQVGFEVCGLAVQYPDPGRHLIREIAEIYGTPELRLHKDGNYTSWEQREGGRRIRMEIKAALVRDEIGDAPSTRTAPWSARIAPRRADPRLGALWSRHAHQNFWGPTDQDSDDELFLHGSRDELAILGMEPRSGRYRSLNSTYGHVACYDARGLVRCIRVGFDVIHVGAESRIAFLVRRGADLDTLLENPAVAISVAKYRIGGAWLQSQGLIEIHDDPQQTTSVIKRLESRYAEVHHGLALGLDLSERPAGGEYVLASISHQRLSSRYREAERSQRSQHSLASSVS
ncbi:hypothetical protein KDL01_00770 [Actinospica durhamensis]|uniref:Uncharacterized protein n=1 Tax=Actinospica durhamensis TaxID=1508375 RepID=A0A941EQ94_9ACTN|nr:hypothetical protein [Actinospica durhamensis]MBR7831769.1 hypothetical protein [Actinospica durhamensis]